MKQVFLTAIMISAVVFLFAQNSQSAKPSNAKPTNTGTTEKKGRFEPRGLGYCGIMDVGTSLLIDNNLGAHPMFSFRFFNGGRLGKNFAMGFQTGVDLGFNEANRQIALITVPGRIAFRANFLKRRISPLLDFDFGYNLYFVGDEKTIAHGPAGGVALGLKVWVCKGLAIGAKAGYAPFLVFDEDGDGQLSHAVPVMLSLEF